MFLNGDQFDKPSCPQILQLRSDNVMYFANAEYTVEHILSYLDKQPKSVKFLLLDFQAVGFIDITAVDELRMLNETLEDRQIQLAFIEVHLPVKQVMESSGFIREIRWGHLVEKKGEAITFLFPHLDHDYCKNACPHALFYECKTVK
jgi:SulP family sulfate permease